jgi:hypothetical protein
LIEQVWLRSQLGGGDASRFMVDPRTLAAYNTIAFGKERIVVANSPVEATGADLRKQFVAGGNIQLESSHFLRAKYQPAKAVAGAPAPPAVTTPAAFSSISGVTTTFASGIKFYYYYTACNEYGESRPTTAVQTSANSTTGYGVTAVLTAQTGVTHFNVYRSPADGNAASCKFIGRVKQAASGNTTFTDIGNKAPGFVTGVLVQEDGAKIKELAPYTRETLAKADLSNVDVHYRFWTLQVFEPRKFVLVDNLTATF